MQELSNSKLSSAYLNGIKDSLNSGNQAAGSDANHAIQDLLRAASLLGGFGFGAGPLAGLSQPANTPATTKSNTPSKSATDSGSSKIDPSPANKNNEPTSNKSTPTPENGQARSSDSHLRGNGKSSHDDTPASDDSGEFLFLLSLPPVPVPILQFLKFLFFVFLNPSRQHGRGRFHDR